MAANDPVVGRITFWSGKVFGQARKLTSELDTSLLDNAVGSKAITLCPAGKVYEEILLDSIRIQLPPGPHVLAGENFYIAIDPDTNAKAVDTTGAAGTVVKFKYLLRDLKSNLAEVRSVTTEIGTRNQTLLDGGITDDPTVYSGRPNAVYAFKLCAPDTQATILGHIQVDIRTTA
jgi:hypothetical protein